MATKTTEKRGNRSSPDQGQASAPSPSLGDLQMHDALQDPLQQASLGYDPGPVQLLARGDGARGADEVKGLAAQGLQGGSGALPHLETIQASFGHHDVGHVQAHVGGPAAAASAQMGADGYATGDHVAFPSTPDLHTAAHEAAHVVQQQGGVSLKNGVGQAGDRHERHADAVADRVVQGQSAEGLLDSVAGGQARAGGGVQLSKPKKEVSSKAFKRLDLGKKAIDHAKSVFTFGAGNQAEALKNTKFNSYFRLKAMRDPDCWELADSVKPIASANREALTAAKADLARGGNCGEHAQVAFDWLRVYAKGETINRSSVQGLDHAFVLMGDVDKESNADLVVSDPWPSEATATLWEDHFAFTADRSKINRSHTMVADGTNVKKVIAAGLKLSRKGRRMLRKSLSKKKTEKTIEDASWIWQHPDAAAAGSDYEYTDTDGK